jgi:exodeoxyribonuclease VII large subunit
MSSQTPEFVLGVSDAIALINQTLEYAYPALVVEGEVASFKVNQNKYVFFDLKDESGTLGCFMTVYQLRIPLEDGMRVRVIANPRLTQWGKFSLTIRDIQPIGEGSLKRAFELLFAKLDKEGLFAKERKRTLPDRPQRIGVISSTAAAGYADFIKILNERWGGMDVTVAHTQVQGLGAASQIIQAISHFNEMSEPPEVLVIIRGGGSADDLSVFNDELLVRAVAGSRVPTLTGIGHEVDTSLVDLAADYQASTPSNAAQVLVPDKVELAKSIDKDVMQIGVRYERHIRDQKQYVDDTRQRLLEKIYHHYAHLKTQQESRLSLLRQLNPAQVLARGYSLMRDENGRITTEPAIGSTITIETQLSIIKAGVNDVKRK